LSAVVVGAVVVVSVLDWSPLVAVVAVAIAVWGYFLGRALQVVRQRREREQLRMRAQTGSVPDLMVALEESAEAGRTEPGSASARPLGGPSRESTQQPEDVISVRLESGLEVRGLRLAFVGEKVLIVEAEMEEGLARESSSSRSAASLRAALTSQELEILELLAAGSTTSGEIAIQLSASESTIRAHLQRISSKLRASRGVTRGPPG
jgi:DNA-binding CsgD family transcriptional regulator